MICHSRFRRSIQQVSRSPPLDPIFWTPCPLNTFGETDIALKHSDFHFGKSPGTNFIRQGPWESFADNWAIDWLNWPPAHLGASCPNSSQINFFVASMPSNHLRLWSKLRLIKFYYNFWCSRAKTALANAQERIRHPKFAGSMNMYKCIYMYTTHTRYENLWLPYAT